MDAKWGTPYLMIYGYTLWNFTLRQETGELISPVGWSYGDMNYRILYQAGYATIDQDLQQACAELAVACYNSRGQNSNLTSENLGSYSYSAIAEKSFASLSSASRNAIESRKNRRLTRYKL